MGDMFWIVTGIVVMVTGFMIAVEDGPDLGSFLFMCGLFVSVGGLLGILP